MLSINLIKSGTRGQIKSNLVDKICFCASFIPARSQKKGGSSNLFALPKKGHHRDGISDRNQQISDGNFKSEMESGSHNMGRR